jgi:putative nucleotidyltransferase with HDIG domain
MFRSIRLKLSIFMFILLILTTFLFFRSTVRIVNQTLLNEIIKKAESISKSAAAIASYSLLSRDLLGIDHIVFKAKESNNDVEYIAIVDTTMKIIAHSDIKQRGKIFKKPAGDFLEEKADGTVIREIPLPSGNLFEISTPILYKGKLLGTVFVSLNRSVLLNAQQLAHRRVFGLFAATLLLGVIVILGLSILITKPIKELSSGVDELKQGKRAKPLKVYSRDELGKLTESFNSMSELITAQKNELIKYTQELEEAYISILRVLAVAIDARDPYTLGHSTRVAANALMIGEEIGLSRKDLEELEIASLFHDVGKLKTPDTILFKSKSLDITEYKEMKQHPNDGAEILRKVKSLHKYIAPVKHHHEFFNGEGYPDRLNGNNIPLFAAIIAIADAFDAITSTRPYKMALSKEEALKVLTIQAGKQFHPDLVNAFLKRMQNVREPSSHSYLSRVI